MKRPRPAELILQELGIAAPKDIDLEAIAWTLGAVVKYRQLDKCEAMIVGSKRKAVITVNSESIPTRRRFSVAHEIGHWHHHRGKVLFCTSREIENPAQDVLNPEYQADEFASDLILPDYLFLPCVSRLKKLTLAAVRALRDDFQSSLTATLMKLVKANHFPILIVCHNRERRRWFKRADMVPGWWFPRDDLDADSFAFDLLFKQAKESAFPRKIGAGAWFDFRNADRYEIEEQSFLLPGDEILTLLSIPQEGLG